MMERPLIALPDAGGGLIHRYMLGFYEKELRQAGARVQWIPRDQPELALSCDGLLLPGGADVEPECYGEEKTPLCGKTDPSRDEWEQELLGAFLPTGKPFLGICRGEQMFNVFRGGTLHQDIRQTQQVKHSDLRRRRRGSHWVTLTPGSRLAAIFGKEKLWVNSLHHQAVKDCAPTLAVAARSSDGFIEALEDPAYPFCLAVQWHPEHMGATEQIKLFAAFTAACIWKKEPNS